MALRVVVYDAAEGGVLGASWWLGSSLLSGADVRIAATSWDGAIAAVRDVGAAWPVDLQIWGHGAPGVPYLAGVPLGSRLDTLAASVPAGSVVWWRSCDVHRGAAGAAFARAVTTRGLTSVGHCTVISWPYPWQQGEICALRPGEDVWWPADGAGLRGCGTLRMSVPPWAYRAAS